MRKHESDLKIKSLKDRLSHQLKDEVDAAFNYRIYQMVGILGKKRLPTLFPIASTSMNELFRQHVEQLHEKFEALMRMDPVTLAGIPRGVPKSGIDLFSEGPLHLYVGRSKRLRQRLRYHCGSAKDAPFAFKLARELTGNTKAAYSTKGSRNQLLSDDTFLTAFQAAKDRILRMNIRFVEEPDPNRQALLEIYATICLAARYNDFDTH